MQIKATMRRHLMPARMANNNKIRNNKLLMRKLKHREGQTQLGKNLLASLSTLPQGLYLGHTPIGGETGR